VRLFADKINPPLCEALARELTLADAGGICRNVLRGDFLECVGSPGDVPAHRNEAAL
jgi:hypothetical protein